MKCLACEWSGEPGGWTCPKCGESSWNVDAMAEPEKPADPPAKKPKKGDAQ